MKTTDQNQPNYLSRRALLRLGLTISPLLVAACAAPTLVQTPNVSATAAPLTPVVEPAAELVLIPTATPAADTLAQTLPPTPACADDDDNPTPAQTEGPYYTPNTPERTSLLEAGISGTNLTVSGVVLTTNCQPVARALLDFWHCDSAGVYDNVGYKLRGHQFTDNQGRFLLETILPALYPGRTRHIHVKVQAPDQPVLTTQLYFPGEPENERDGIYNPALLMDVQEVGQAKAATFTFVLQV
jgi:protocatechuate 3,4-dioxygenase beta subunit